MDAVHLVEPLIIGLLADQDHFVRAEAARTLAYCNTPLAHKSLQNALKDRSVAVREAAEQSLQKLSAEGRMTTAGSLSDGAGGLRRQSAHRPARRGCPRVKGRCVVIQARLVPICSQLLLAQTAPVDSTPWVPLTQWSDIPVGLPGEVRRRCRSSSSAVVVGRACTAETRRAASYYSPRRLFNDLCTLHELDWPTRKLLRQTGAVPAPGASRPGLRGTGLL